MKEKIKVFLKFFHLYRFLTKIYDYLLYILRFIKILKSIIKIDSNVEVFFFFPFYHTGGAENVHLNIVKAMQGKTVTFFTLPSANAHFLSEFQKYSECHFIEKMIRSNWSKKILLRCISFKINHQQISSAFGCHSLFFYELLPYLNTDVKCTDLIHAFTRADEPGFEKFSLPYLHRLNHRITISQKGKKDLIEQYKAINIYSDLENRIQVIYNSTNFKCEEIPVKATDVFNIVYVGRNSPEKRISLIGKIATDLKKIDIRYKLIFVGENLEQGVNPQDRHACTFLGNITNLEELEQIYRAAHVVLIASTREGIPMVLVEGMVFGAVPVSTNVGGISELIEQDVTGKLIPIENSNNTQEYIEVITFLKENKSAYEEISLNCAKKVQDLFSSSLFNSNYKTLIDGEII